MCRGRLPLVAIGKHGLTFEARSVQDLETLGEADLLRDVRDKPQGMKESGTPLAVLAGKQGSTPQPRAHASDSTSS